LSHLRRVTKIEQKEELTILLLKIDVILHKMLYFLFGLVLTDRVMTQLELTKLKVQELEDKIKRQPTNLHEYVEYSDFLNSANIQDSYSEV